MPTTLIISIPLKSTAKVPPNVQMSKSTTICATNKGRHSTRSHRSSTKTRLSGLKTNSKLQLIPTPSLTVPPLSKKRIQIKSLEHFKK